MIVQSLAKGETDAEKSEKTETGIELNILANLIHFVAYPFLIYHKDFI